MKQHLLLSAITAASLCACNQAGKTTDNRDSVSIDTTNATQTTSGINCYQQVTGRDSFFLNLIQAGDSVTGTLEYNFFEKDDAKGAFTGVLRNNILRLRYAFQSEGTTTTQDKIFKRNGDQLVEARPDKFSSIGDPLFPAEDQALVYDSIPWKQVNCR
ncbi:hypothetical protein MKQ70_04650 [Chitinophaga sedimenti]|uniref:hypothetical protein n=1 Tax=Chitinophaga sedimenti TaxID=2033606 RepID=UPI002002DC0E|nr:hypothetical protein [Chitinophaga sedimenti]MCK7554333.1 hypothetical protein [Chitinophaga sedimenti]